MSNQNQSFEIAPAFRGRCQRESAMHGMYMKPDAQTHSRLTSVLLPLFGMFVLCGLYVAIRNRGQISPINHDADSTSALRYTRILCRALTNHSLARVVTIEPILTSYGQPDPSSAVYEVIFETDDGCRYKDCIEGRTGYVHSFYRYHLPTAVRLKPGTKPGHLAFDGIGPVRAKSMATQYLRTLGYDTTNLELLHVGPAYHKSVDYVFRRARAGLPASNILVGINRKDGGLDQLWLQGED